MGLERRLERYSGNASGIVRDRRRGDDGDDLEREILAETGGDELIDIAVVEVTALLSRFSPAATARRACRPSANGAREWAHVGGIQARLEAQRRVECNRPRAFVGHRIGKQHSLDLRFGETAAVDIAEQTNQAVDQHGRARHARWMFGIMPKPASSCLSAGFERSGAISIVRMGKCVI